MKLDNLIKIRLSYLRGEKKIAGLDQSQNAKHRVKTRRTLWQKESYSQMGKFEKNVPKLI